MKILCPPHTRLQDHLLKNGIHILTACGGRGNCGKCRVIAPKARINTMDRFLFTEEELQEGWRLGCQVFSQESALEVKIP